MVPVNVELVNHLWLPNIFIYNLKTFKVPTMFTHNLNTFKVQNIFIYNLKTFKVAFQAITFSYSWVIYPSPFKSESHLSCRWSRCYLSMQDCG